MNDLETARILFNEAKNLGLNPQWLTEYGLFSINLDNTIRFVFCGISYLNSQMSSYLCRNKHATRKVLDLFRLPNIPYALPATDEEALFFLKKYKRIVVKPTVGSRSENVHLITEKSQLKNIDRATSIFEKFIEGREFRYLVLKNQVIAVHERIFPGLLNDPRVVKRISYPQNKWEKKLIAISLKATQALGTKFAAVDFKIDKNENPYILEVNAAAGIKWFHYPSEGPSVNVANLLLTATIEELRNKNTMQ